MQNIKYCFLHIQKTSGTSVVKYLHYVMDPSKFYDHYEARYPSSFGNKLFNDEFDSSGIEFLHGHLDFSQIKIINPYAKIITMLREPISRTRSQYYWHKFYFGKLGIDWIVDDIAKLPEMLATHHSPFADYDNAMTRMISGVGYHMPLGSISNKILDLAKRNLEEMFFIGYQEQFKESIGRLLNKFGVASESAKFQELINMDEIVTMNITDKSKPLSDNEYQILEELNSFDIQLYQFAKENFPL